MRSMLRLSAYSVFALAILLTRLQLSLKLLATALSGDAEQALALLASGAVCVGMSSMNTHSLTHTHVIHFLADVCDSNGHNTLFLACIRSHTALINILLDNGANINQCVLSWFLFKFSLFAS